MLLGPNGNVRHSNVSDRPVVHMFGEHVLMFDQWSILRAAAVLPKNVHLPVVSQQVLWSDVC